MRPGNRTAKKLAERMLSRAKLQPTEERAKPLASRVIGREKREGEGEREEQRVDEERERL